MSEIEQFNQLLQKKNKKYKDLRKIILTIKKHNLKLPDAVLEYGIKLIQNHKSKIGDEYYLILEEIYHASIELSMLSLSFQSLKQIQLKFPDSCKLTAMKATYFNNDASNESKVLEFLDKAVQENRTDLIARKMKIATERQKGRIEEFITSMNQYLEDNPSDPEAWLELADLYLEHQNYTRAAHCYEEIIQILPKKLFYMIKLAEIYYTLGATQNYLNAKNYYSLVLSKDSSNPRALWGLHATIKKLEKNKKLEESTSQLGELTVLKIKEQYKKHSVDKFINNYKFQ